MVKEALVALGTGLVLGLAQWLRERRERALREAGDLRTRSGDRSDG